MNDALLRTSVSLILALGLSGPMRAQDNDKVRETVKRLEAVLSQVDQHLAERATHETELVDAKSESLELRQRLTLAMAQIKERERADTAQRSQLTRLEADLEARTREARELGAVAERLRGRETELSTQVDRLQADLEARVPAEEHARTLDALRAELEQRDAGTAAMRDELAAAKAAVTQRDEELAHMREEAARWQSQQVDLQRELAAAKAESVRIDAEHKRALQDAERSLAARDQELSTLRADAEQREATARDASTELGNLRAESTAELARQQTALDTQVARAETLQREATSMAAARDELLRDAAALNAALAAESRKAEQERTARLRSEAEVQRLRAQLDGATVRRDDPPLQIHHHGSGDIILQIPARQARGTATGGEAPPLDDQADKGRIDE
ncbi:MAG: hypothetical protein R3F56_10730 [Planctomycetota bacterium]